MLSNIISNSELFELLAMCGMLMDFNWTEILKRRELLRLTITYVVIIDYSVVMQ